MPNKVKVQVKDLDIPCKIEKVNGDTVKLISVSNGMIKRHVSLNFSNGTSTEVHPLDYVYVLAD